MDPRVIQLEAGACWCGNPHFADGSGSDVSLHSSASRESTLWCLITVFGLTFRQADFVVSEFGLALHPASWFYGCREAHSARSSGSYPQVHACVVLLVAYLFPV